MSNPSKSSITIEAPSDEVQKTLFDLESYPSWSTTFKSVTVLQRDGDGRPTQVVIAVDAGALKDKVTLDYDWSGAPELLTFTLNDATMLTEMTGSYEIADNGDDTTTVSFELTVAISIPIPEMMRRKAEESTIDLALAQLKKKLEE